MTKTSLSVLLIGPEERRRRALADAFVQQGVTITGELGAYPSFNHLLKLTESECDVLVVDIDRDHELALDLVENVCARNSAITVMVYSSDRDPDLLVKCMRAGAREFLGEPLSSEALAEAVVRASARRLELDRQKRLTGKLFVFWGAKGGTGVTTLASNFAIALKRESAQTVVLVDLNPQLGDVRVILGLEPKNTLADALHDSDRLDRDFVSTLLVEHQSGISVLATPDHYTPSPLVQNGTVGKLMHLLRDQFPFVVVDAGRELGEGADSLFEMADVVYVVSQAEIAALRNAQRMLAHIQRIAGAPERRIEVVLNRYDPRKVEIDQARIAKVLSVPLKWKVPNDYSAVRSSLDTAAPLALQNTSVTRIIYQMAREACDKPLEPRKSKWLF